MLNSNNAELFLYKPWKPKVFSIWNHHKCLSFLFPLHLNTYVMGLRPLEIFQFFQCGDRLYTSESDVYGRQILTIKVKPLRCSKASFCISEEWPNFLRPRGYRTKIFIELFTSESDVRFRRMITVPALKGLMYVPMDLCLENMFSSLLAKGI